MNFRLKPRHQTEEICEKTASFYKYYYSKKIFWDVLIQEGIMTKITVYRSNIEVPYAEEAGLYRCKEKDGSKLQLHPVKLDQYTRAIRKHMLKSLRIQKHL